MQTGRGITKSTLIKAMNNTEFSADEITAVNEALVRCECTTVNRAAMWLAQIGHESVGLRYYEEIASGAAYEGRADLGNTQRGDGVRFKGRGPIQVTGRANYRSLSKWAHGKGYVPTATYFVDNPAQLGTIRYGFLGAVWYWTVARPMNSYADKRDIRGATLAVNGGLNGYDDRVARWNRCLALGTAILPATTTTQGGPLMALSDKEQSELLASVRYIRDQLGPNKWGPESSLGLNAQGQENTLRDGIADLKRKVEGQ